MDVVYCCCWGRLILGMGEGIFAYEILTIGIVSLVILIFLMFDGLFFL